MRLAFSTLACPAWSLDQIFEAAPRYGYDGIEMRILAGEVLTPALPAMIRQQVRTMSRRMAIPIICVDTSVSVGQTDSTTRAAQLQDGLAMLALAAQWEAPAIRIFTFIPMGADSTTAFNAAVDGWSQLAVRGAELGIKVLVETHDPIATGAGVASLLNAIPNLAAGALWDMLHPYRLGETPETTLSALGKRLHHVHVKDGQQPVDGGSTWPLTLLGEGSVPVPHILRLLQAEGYSGWLSVEWEKKWHPEIAEPDIALPQHSAQLREYLAAL
jgi:sugar phosphate isomerase/epimerase